MQIGFLIEYVAHKHFSTRKGFFKPPIDLTNLVVYIRLLVVVIQAHV